MAVEHVNPDTLFRLPAFSQIVVAPPGQLAFIAGQGPFDADFNLVGGEDLKAQTIQAFRNLKAALEAVRQPTDQESFAREREKGQLRCINQRGFGRQQQWSNGDQNKTESEERGCWTKCQTGA